MPKPSNTAFVLIEQDGLTFRVAYFPFFIQKNGGNQVETDASEQGLNQTF
jgi:hypothetical protein